MYPLNSLLLYKQRPARLLRSGERLEIEMNGGEKARVRIKDVLLLHPGPLHSLAELKPSTRASEDAVHEAWEILAGEQTTLSELAGLVFGIFTPATAWSAWQLVMEGLYFEGSPENVRARSIEEVARRKLEKDQAEATQRAWKAFIERVKRGEIIAADREFLNDVEYLAMGRAERSQVMRELGRVETPENAHALLLDLGVWDITVNPYPARQGVLLQQPDLPVPALPEESRRDLTHLAAYAIDDAGTDTPDDALSLEEGPNGPRLWVHVADVAALVEPDSPLDQEARTRGMSLHLPEGTIHLLPREVTLRLGLGLNEISPALSFGLDMTENGEVRGFEIVPSRVRVRRMSYEEAETLLDQPALHTLERLVSAVRGRRVAGGAVMIDFPEVKIDADHGQVSIRPLPPLRSRALVEEAMILTGAETARFAREHALRLPFSQQETLETDERPLTLSGMFALRRLLKRSRVRLEPAPHSGLGVPAYTQVTSPLRRYLDLVAHQQIRAFLLGKSTLGEEELFERLGAFEAVVGTIRQAEILSERHWTMVYLLQNPEWRGEGIVVDKRGALGTLIIPSLAVETRVHLSQDVPLDAMIPLSLSAVNLPQRDAVFRIERRS